jgi:hypothetical protein
MVNPLDDLARWPLQASLKILSWLLFALPTWHWSLILSISFVSILFLVLGRRLRRFNHPDRPLLSPVIRAVAGHTIMWLGSGTLFAITMVGISIPILLAVATASISLRDHLSFWSTFLHYLFQTWPVIALPLFSLASGVVVGLCVSAYLVFLKIPLWERGEGLRDVRHMKKLFGRMRQFSPLKYFDISKGLFVGLEDGVRPVYIPFKVVHETHMQVLGASGGGKGISLGVLSYQFILAGECTILIDPKGDRRIPLILESASRRANVKFHHIDLNPGTQPQFNILAGATDYEIEELLVGGLGLEPSHGDGNYYRGIDQDVAQQVAIRAARMNSPAMSDLLDIASSDKSFEKADNFLRRLRQLCDLPAIQTNHDIDFAGILERGEVLYIRGSTDNHRVKSLQTMLLIRLMQIIKKRDPSSRRVCLMLDEFKHLLCHVSIDSLGTIRELGCHAVLAHQSLGDLGAIPGLRREDVEPRVVDNTTLKLVFRIGDEKASASFAAKSGKQRTHAEGVRAVNEHGHDQRSWTETQQFRMSEDLFTHLHRPSDGQEVVAACVLFGYKYAQLLAISPMTVQGKVPPATAAPRQNNSAPKQPSSLI